MSNYEQSLKIEEELGDRAGVAVSLYQIGRIQQLRGDFDQALEYYQRSLKIEEELGDRAGAGMSLGQIGRLLTKNGRYAEAFEHMLLALTTFLELKSSYVRAALTDLKALRNEWGEQNFDAAWKDATETDVPDWLTSESDESTSEDE